MNYKDFGLLVRELRLALSRQRMEEITQEDLGEMINVSGAVIGKIERGELKCLPPEYVKGLANVFELTQMERQEFFLAANGISYEEGYSTPNTPEQELKRILDRFNKITFPAMLTDAVSDIIAVNFLMLRFYGLSSSERISELEKHPFSSNLLWYIFSSKTDFFELAASSRKEWDRVIISNVQFFRRTSLRYRTTPYWKALFQTLYSSPDRSLRTLFRKYWIETESEDDIDDYNFGRHYRIRNPMLHRKSKEDFDDEKDSEIIEFVAMTSEEITGYGSLFITVYLPVSTNTRKLFDRLLEEEGMHYDGYGVHYRELAGWPIDQKSVPQF